MAELAKRYDVHPNRITQRKVQLLEQVAKVFDRPSQAASPPTGVTVLHAKIGLLTQENDFLRARSQKRD